MLEADYQRGLIKRIESRFPGSRIEHNQKKSPNYRQGWPDLTIFFDGRYVFLEVKKSNKAPFEPNQEYYLDLLSQETFTSVIYPENEEEVLNALQHAFASSR